MCGAFTLTLHYLVQIGCNLSNTYLYVTDIRFMKEYSTDF